MGKLTGKEGVMKKWDLSVNPQVYFILSKK